jgi:general secretion pathway protein C
MIQDLIKRNFWVFGALAIAVCAVFAAKTTSNIVEAKVLGDSDKIPKPAPTTTAPAPVVSKPTHSKDGTQLAQRNMFCSDCTPPVPDPTTSKSIDSSTVVNTSLPLSLLATNISTKPADSYATIINTESQHQGAFVIGDKVPGATGAVTAIHYKFIEFENGGHTERLGLLGAVVEPVKVAVAEPEKTDENKDDMQVAVDNGVKKLDDANYEIDRALVDKILANPMAVSKMARVVPSMKNGKPDGFKLYAIRPTSVYAKIGLQNGDTLNAINGMTLESADKALEVYTKLKDANQLEVELTRRGKTQTMKYAIK